MIIIQAKSIISLSTTWCNKVKLKISAERTFHAPMKGKLQRDPLIRVEAQIITRQETIRYLGLICTCQKTALRLLYRRWLRKSNISHAGHSNLIPKARYMNFILTFIIGYNGSAWAHHLSQRVKLKERVNRAQWGVLVLLTDTFNATPTEALESCHYTWKKRQRSTWGSCYYQTRSEQHSEHEVAAGVDDFHQEEKIIQFLPDVHRHVRNIMYQPFQSLIYLLMPYTSIGLL